MIRTDKTVEVLKPIAIVAALAILLWSLGLPSLRFAEAASLTHVSDTLSDSAPSAGSDHTIVFTSPSGVATSSSFTLDFSGTGFDLSQIRLADINLATTSNYTLTLGTPTANQWKVTTTTTAITFTSASTGTYVSKNGTTTVKIGKNTTAGATAHQIINPATEGSKTINLTTSSGDSGAAMVVILSSVTVSAAVNTIFTFSVSGTTAGTSVNGTTTTGSTGSTTLPFGTLKPDKPTTTAQLLSVSTNAKNGYVVTVQLDGALRSSTGATIDGFNNGSDTNTPTNWQAPYGTVGSPSTYGHWAVTSDDTNIPSRTNQFGSDQWVAASTTPRAVMGNSGPANASGQGIGTTTVGYNVEISPLQEAGDYSATLTYVATPTF